MNSAKLATIVTYYALGFGQILKVLLDVDNERVDIARVLTVAILIHFLSTALLEEALQLIILYVHSQILLCLLMHKGSNSSDCLSWFPAHGHRIKLEILFRSDSQQRAEAPEC